MPHDTDIDISAADQMGLGKTALTGPRRNSRLGSFRDVAQDLRYLLGQLASTFDQEHPKCCVDDIVAGCAC